MQTLGLSESTPRTEGRLKSLFWPSIQSGADVDYLGVQGYWLCAVVGVFSFVVVGAAGHWIAGAATLLLYYLSGVGIRERSRFAAALVLLVSCADTLAAGASVFRILFTALLLSNLRATWIASAWKPDSEEAALPQRMADTWADKFADRFPSWLWPKVRLVYYVFSVCFVAVLAVGLVVIFSRSHR